MAKSTEFRTQQKALFFRRIQVILMGVIAVSAIEHSAKRAEQFQADNLRSVKDQRATQRIAKTAVPRKSIGQSVTPKQAKPPTKSAIALKSNKTSLRIEN